MSGVKMLLGVKTLGARPGDVIEVESDEIADHLEANGLARRVKADEKVPAKKAAARPRARKVAAKKPAKG